MPNNNIPQGYKQTELGTIPEDWEIVCLKDVAKVNGRIGFRGYTVADLVDAGQGAYVIGGKHISGSIVDLSEAEYISWTKYYESPEIMVQCGDIVMAQRGTLGKNALIDHEIGPATINPSLVLINHIKCNNLYLNYWLQSEQANNAICSLNCQTSIPMITQWQIEHIPIALSIHKKEQHAIAEALSDVDALIAALDKKIVKKRLIKQGAMIRLLGGQGKNVVTKKIKNIVLIKKGNMLTSGQYIVGNIPVIAGGKSAAGYHNVANRLANTITISASGASAGYVAFHDYPIFATDCSTIEPSKSYDIKYIYYLLLFYQSELYALQTGGAQPHVHPNDIYDLNIHYNSDIETQRKIATILSDMDKEIADLEACRDKYKFIKSGMMQKLLTGQIRLIKPLAPIIPLVAPETKIREIPLQTHIVAGHIVNTLYQSLGWGRTKLQKTLHLVGYHCQLDFGNEYIRNTAGPDDQAMMNHIDSKFKQYRHVRIEAKKDNNKTRYNYIPTAMIDELEQVYETYPQTIRDAVDSLINKIKKMDLARAEIVSTLYAVWNNRIIKEEQISDDLLLADFYAWSKHKSDFSRDLVLRGLNYMRKEKIIPTGWGKYIDKSNNIK